LDHVNSLLDVFERLREPHGPHELVGSCSMAGGMKPDSVLVHRLCAPRPIDLLFAPSTRTMAPPRTARERAVSAMPYAPARSVLSRTDDARHNRPQDGFFSTVR
jgi:hypothetical protein